MSKNMNEPLNINLINKLFTDPLTPENYIKNDHIYEYIEYILSLYGKVIKTEFENYLNNYEDKNNSFYLYYSGRLESNEEKRKELYQRSADLNNGYAIVELAIEFLEEKEIEEFTLKAYDLGSFRSLYPLIEMKLISSKDLYGYNDISPINMERIKGNIKYIIEKLELLEKLDIQNAYKYITKVYGEIIDMDIPPYTREKYSEKYFKYRIFSGEDPRTILQEDGESIFEIAQKYYELKKQYEELQKSYNEMIRVKNFDFNSVVSGDVGEYLNQK